MDLLPLNMTKKSLIKNLIDSLKIKSEEPKYHKRNILDTSLSREKTSESLSTQKNKKILDPTIQIAQYSPSTGKNVDESNIKIKENTDLEKRLIEKSNVRHSNLDKQEVSNIIDFSIYYDVPYRLKKIDTTITNFGYNLTKEIYNIFIGRLADSLHLNSEEMISLRPRKIDYKNLLIANIGEIHRAMDGFIYQHSDSANLVKNYLDIIPEQKTRNEFEDFFKQKVYKNTTLGSDSSELAETLSSNEHITNYLRFMPK